MKLPWKKLKIPDYKAVESGDWSLTQHDVPYIRGYFNGLQRNKLPNWVLEKGNEIWMSLTPMEVESQAPHAAAAYGHTVIMGFGMGMLTYNVLKNPKVTKVTAIEIEPEVVELMRLAANMEDWQGIEKLEIVIADALTWTPDEQVNVVLADIWADIGSMRLRGDMQTIQKNVKPDLIAGWSMELDYVTWMQGQGYEPGDEDAYTYSEYVEDIGLPLIEQGSDAYPPLALAAARNVVMYFWSLKRGG